MQNPDVVETLRSEMAEYRHKTDQELVTIALSILAGAPAVGVLLGLVFAHFAQ